MQKVISLVLSVLLLVSSANITYAKHFCGDYEVLSIVAFGEISLSCSEKENTTVCEDKKKEQKSCCSTQYDNVELDDNFESPSIHNLIKLPTLKKRISNFVVPIVVIEPKRIVDYAFYDPPPIANNISVLYQVFII